MDRRRREFLMATAAAVAGATLPWPLAAAEARNGMPYRPLGSTGETVSLLGLGGSHIGQGNVTEDEAIRIMRTAIDEGVNFFDNAWAYFDGKSEERMGKALKDGYRDKVFLMTKHKGRDRATAREQLETSLKRLGVDHIDLWQFHEVVHPDFPRMIYESGALDVAIEARKQGKIRYIGFTGHHYPKYLNEMLDRGFAFDTLQMPLNVFDYHFRSFEHDTLPKALDKKMGVIAMKTLGGNPGTIPNASKAATAEECLRYAMSLPVSTVCSGMESMERLKLNLAIAKGFKPFQPDELAALLKRTAPEAADGNYEPYKTKWHPEWG